VIVARDREQLAAALFRQSGRRGVVMTMGALHDGHATLMRAARSAVDHVVATIFVNPLQFGPGEDFDRYPRTLDADLALCEAAGVDVVFAPSGPVHDPLPLVRVSAGPLGTRFEGAARPGHFDGVLTIVATLLNLVRPDVAFFGQKDAQQLACIRRMVADLAMGVEIVGVPTVREADGLARSSRNRYLTPEQHTTALALSRALFAARDAAPQGAAAARSAAERVLADAAAQPGAGLAVDYCALLDEPTFAEVDEAVGAATGPAVLCVAARVGSTRLIDNLPLVLGDPSSAVPLSATAPSPAR
jgi:pantoate--beta-alanine ligase